jgi:hypothetical protein
MSVQSDGRVLKVSDEPAAKPKKQEEDDAEVQRKLEEYNDYLSNKRKEMLAGIVEEEQKGMEIKEHSSEKDKPKVVAKVADTEVKPEASVTEKKLEEGMIKEHKVAPEVSAVKVGEIKSHDAAQETEFKLPEGVVLLEVEAGESEESWKSAFFFFASLVLIVVLVGATISMFYFNKEQAAKKAEADKVAFKAGTKKEDLQASLQDSSSTSDSGEKIAMLFDRVRKSLEDLSDKTPAEQADVAGGQAQNTI